MGKKDFEQFLIKNQLPVTVYINWPERKQIWLEKLEQFFSLITTYLHNYIESGQISIESKDMTLFEEKIGSYHTKIFVIKLSNQLVKLEPVGTNIVGGFGLVDMVGEKGTVKFVLTEEDCKSVKIICQAGKNPFEEKQVIPSDPSKWVWKIATTPPKISFINFNEDSFFDALMEILIR